MNELKAEVAAGNDPFDKCAKVMATGNEIANTAHHMMACAQECVSRARMAMLGQEEPKQD